MSGLFRYDDKTKQGKYLVTRRDGSHPEWPYIVLGARDEAAVAGLNAYADKAAELGYDPQYVADVRRLATEFDAFRAVHGKGNPDGGPDRVDDPATVSRMVVGVSA